MGLEFGPEKITDDELVEGAALRWHNEQQRSGGAQLRRFHEFLLISDLLSPAEDLAEERIQGWAQYANEHYRAATGEELQLPQNVTVWRQYERVVGAEFSLKRGFTADDPREIAEAIYNHDKSKIRFNPLARQPASQLKFDVLTMLLGGDGASD